MEKKKAIVAKKPAAKKPAAKKPAAKKPAAKKPASKRGGTACGEDGKGTWSDTDLRCYRPKNASTQSQNAPKQTQNAPKQTQNVTPHNNVIQIGSACEINGNPGRWYPGRNNMIGPKSGPVCRPNVNAY